MSSESPSSEAFPNLVSAFAYPDLADSTRRKQFSQRKSLTWRRAIFKKGQKWL